MTLLKKTNTEWQGGGGGNDSLGSTLRYKIIYISKLKFQKKHLAQLFESLSWYKRAFQMLESTQDKDIFKFLQICTNH